MSTMTDEFMLWWEKTGCLTRSGGGDYERTFAFEAWRTQATRIAELQAQLADAKQVANDCRIVADNAIVEALGEKKPDCAWEEYESGSFKTQCGSYFNFDEGGIEENDCKFCQYCGGAVKEST